MKISGKSMTALILALLFALGVSSSLAEEPLMSTYTEPFVFER